LILTVLSYEVRETICKYWILLKGNLLGKVVYPWIKLISPPLVTGVAAHIEALSLVTYWLISIPLIIIVKPLPIALIIISLLTDVTVVCVASTILNNVSSATEVS